MRPAPIPDDLIPPGCKRIVIGPPGNDLESMIAPVEALAHQDAHYGVAAYSVRCILEEGDLDALRAGAGVWVTFFEHVVPFDVQVA